MSKQIEGALLPCPFCGSAAKETGYNVRCTNDACALRYDGPFVYPEDWNQRAPIVVPFIELKKALDELTDVQRDDLFSNYCRHCASKDLPCYCWRDE